MAATPATLVGAKCRNGDYDVPSPGVALSTVAADAAVHVQINRGHIIDIIQFTGTFPFTTTPVAQVVTN